MAARRRGARRRGRRGGGGRGAPAVTGDVNVDALEDLVRLCVELDARRRDGTRDAAWAAIEQQVIGKAADLLSGPGGLASFLRRRQLGVRLGGPSLPLDIGYAETIPAGIRNAVLLRDRHSQWAGGCTQPPRPSQRAHNPPKARRGVRSRTDGVAQGCASGQADSSRGCPQDQRGWWWSWMPGRSVPGYGQPGWGRH